MSLIDLLQRSYRLINKALISREYLWDFLVKIFILVLNLLCPRTERRISARTDIQMDE